MRIEVKSVPPQLKIDGIVTRSRQVNDGDALIQTSRLEARVLISGAARDISTNWAVTYRSEDGAFIGNDSDCVMLKPAPTSGHAPVSMDVSVPEGATVAEIEISMERRNGFDSFFWSAAGVVALGIATVWLARAVISLFAGWQ